MNRATGLVAAAALAAAHAIAAAGPPLAGVWNIATSGKAGSGGELEFRITANDGSDPVDITVPVAIGAAEDSVARSIQRVLSTQLPRDRYSVRLGEGTNVMVSDPRGRPNFSLELVDSDIADLRVAVQSVTPSAPPTVPPQASPAAPPSNSMPVPARAPVPSPAVPPSNPTLPVPNPSPSKSPDSPPRLPNTSPPANTSGGSGVPASAPPPGS